MKNLVFDIETIPDLDFGRKHLNLDGLSDEDVGKSMFFQQHQRNGSEFLPYDLHQIIAVSILIDDSENLSIQSYNVDGSYNEKSILIDLFKLITKLKNTGVQTSFFRELTYCMDHCIHHQSLIKIALLEQKLIHLIDPNFGVAFSTQLYRNQCAS